MLSQEALAMTVSRDQTRDSFTLHLTFAGYLYYLHGMGKWWTQGWMF